MKRSNSHIWVGLAFVLAAAAVAGGIYGGLKWGREQGVAATASGTPTPQVQATMSRPLQTVTATDSMESTVPTAPSLTTEWLTGSWVLTPKGGDDGRTQCSDYANATLTGLNNGTSKILTFRSNGQFRSMFNYTTENGEQNHQPVKANWEISNQTVILTEMVIEDPTNGDVGHPVGLSVNPQSDNVLSSNDGARFVRCVGETGSFYNDE